MTGFGEREESERARESLTPEARRALCVCVCVYYTTPPFAQEWRARDPPLSVNLNNMLYNKLPLPLLSDVYLGLRVSTTPQKAPIEISDDTHTNPYWQKGNTKKIKLSLSLSSPVCVSI